MRTTPALLEKLIRLSQPSDDKNQLGEWPMPVLPSELAAILEDFRRMRMCLSVIAHEPKESSHHKQSSQLDFFKRTAHNGLDGID